jgi:hypothetical protein
MRHKYQITTKKSNGEHKLIEEIKASSPANAQRKFKTQRIKPRNWSYQVRYQGKTKHEFKVKN